MDSLNRRTSQSSALPAQQQSKAATGLLSSLLGRGSPSSGKVAETAGTQKPTLGLWDRMKISNQSHIDTFFARRDDKHASSGFLPNQIGRHERSYRQARADIKEDLTRHRLAELEAKQNGMTVEKSDWDALQARSNQAYAAELHEKRKKQRLADGDELPSAVANPEATFDKILSDSGEEEKKL